MDNGGASRARRSRGVLAVSRSGGGGGLRRVVAALLTFALLSLSSAPASAWPQAPIERSDGRAAAVDCGPHGGHDGAAPAAPEQGPPRGHSGHDSLPALACCVALHCPMPPADLQPAPAESLAPAGLRVRAAVVVRRIAGVEVAPALRPPRDAV